MRYQMLAAFLMGALAMPGFAQDPGAEPDHGVARISLISGDVTVRRGDSGEEIAGDLNAPLVARDHVITERGARAEIQLDYANMLRLAPASEVRMAVLSDRNFRVELAEGTMTFRVLRDSRADVEISTPTASIRPRRQGIYRITIRDDFSTEITVRSGESDVFVGNDFSPLRAGQTLLVRGDPANPERNFVSFLPRDDWDSWNESRDRDLERSDSYKYVSRDIYGADDLHGHGRWVYDSPYGWVWAPNVVANWAPYRDGRWYYADYYGWTWISADPWGWAPYHYGNWYHAPRYGWVWYPGAIGPRHYWRPALVSFFGWGVNIGSVNLSFGFGNVGWVPLAPYEVYRPWYGRNVAVVNVVNSVNVINTYRNARYIGGRNGVTSVVAGDFGRRRVTVNDYVVARDRDLDRAGDVRGRMPFESSRDSRQFSDRQVVVSRDGGRRNDNNRQVVVSRPESRSIDRGFVRQPATAPRQSIQNRPERVTTGERVAIAPRREPMQTRAPEVFTEPPRRSGPVGGGSLSRTPSQPQRAQRESPQPNRQQPSSAIGTQGRRQQSTSPAVSGNSGRAQGRRR